MERNADAEQVLYLLPVGSNTLFLVEAGDAVHPVEAAQNCSHVPRHIEDPRPIRLRIVDEHLRGQGRPVLFRNQQHANRLAVLHHLSNDVGAHVEIHQHGGSGKHDDHQEEEDDGQTDTRPAGHNPTSPHSSRYIALVRGAGECPRLLLCSTDAQIIASNSSSSTYLRNAGSMYGRPGSR